MTTSTLTRLAPTQVELEIPLPPEEIAAAQQRAFARLAQKVRIPGFRRGKIPRRLFEQTYGTDAIESEALDDVAPVVYERAVREHDLDPVDRPKIEVVPDESGRPVRLKATVEVRPHIELGEYTNVTVRVPAFDVSDQDVQQTMESFARERATLVPVERAARLGDAVTIDYEGTIDGVPFEGGAARRQQTELVEQRFIPGFAAGIAGMSPGESKTFAVTFPQGYANEELAGKDAEFSVTLHEVKEIDVPALDDELARSVADVENLDALRAEVRKRLEAVAQGRRRRIIGNAVMQQLLERLEVPVPAGLVEREIESTLADTAGRAERNGMSFEEYLTKVGATEEQLRDRFREDALVQVKGTLVLEAIAKAEGIEATPAEIRAEVEGLARSYGQTPERMRQALGGNTGPLKEGIIRGKAMDVLIDHATVETAAGGESTDV